jgi:AcrR family transcriptional regulator
LPGRRFAKVAPERQKAILTAAIEEFAAHGFDGASYNRIIGKAGLSKGAMYYYFDDKRDLYATVLAEVQERYLREFSTVASATTAEEFWSEMAENHARTLALVHAEPLVMGLVRSLVKARNRPDLGEAVGRVYRRQREFLAEILRRGQALGAVRTDLPFDLLIELLLALDDAGDAWFSANWERLEASEASELGGILLGVVRRLLLPPEPPRDANPPRRSRSRNAGGEDR